jgi:prolipoprotein diacylglyceryltransferase
VTFPVYIPLGPWHVHPHALFDLLSYTVGAQVYWWLHRTGKVERHPFEQMMWVIVGMTGGAMAGAKLLAWAESWPVFIAHYNELAVWLGGKTIVGGLLGGWIGVEIAKRCIGMKRSTGDAVVFAVLVGIAIGRIGCFLTGVSDATCGTSSSVPWGIDMGDGIRRHPTQLYEIAFLVILGTFLWRLRRVRLPDGTIFRLFMAGYLLFRFAVEFIKPREFQIGGVLSPIQIACAIGGVVALLAVRRNLNEFRPVLVCVEGQA